MANEQLTIEQDKARLSVIGKSWPDMNFDSGIGLDLSQIIFDILIDLDIPMPDIDLDDLDDIPIIPGLDIDTEIPTLEYPDPDWPDDEIPPIIDWPMPDLDWDDFIDKLEDLDLDPDILKDLSFTGLDDLGIPTLVSLDMDFNIQMDNCPESIVVVTPPNKTEYTDGERINLTGMVVTAKKEDGSTWTSAKYPNGHIPLGELRSDAIASVSKAKGYAIIPEGYNLINDFTSTIDIGYICDIFTDDVPLIEGNDEYNARIQESMESVRSAFQTAAAGGYGGGAAYAYCGEWPKAGISIISTSRFCGVITLKGPPNESGLCEAEHTSWGYYQSYKGYFELAYEQKETIRYPLFSGTDPSGKISNVDASVGYVQNVNLAWETPCLQELETSFEINVKPKEQKGPGGGGR